MYSRYRGGYYGGYYKPPPPPLFLPVACIGLTREEYSIDQRLEKAPFLFYKFTVATFEELESKVVELMKELPITTATATATANATATATLSKPPPLPRLIQGRKPIYEIKGIHEETKLVFGPVYLLSAYDIEKRNIEAYLMFPSMTKQGTPWPSYYFLGLAHRWAFRLFMGTNYYIYRPNSKCGLEVADSPPDFILGCRTDASGNCVQSKRAHKRMRIYSRKKPGHLYPAAYFRVYKIDPNHEKVSDLYNPNSFTVLQRNVLPEGIEMFSGCRYMLISENQRYFCVLGRSWLGLYENVGMEDLTTLCMRGQIPYTAVPKWIRRFPGVVETTLVIEDSTIRITSKSDPDASEQVVAEYPLPKRPSPVCLVLTNDGQLDMVDADNTSTLMGTTGGDDRYDPEKDYRERLINLIAYLKYNQRYREVQLSAAGPEERSGRTIEANDPKLGPYDAKVDYVERLRGLIESLRGRMKPSDPYYDHEVMANGTASTTRISAADASDPMEDPNGAIEDDEQYIAATDAAENQQIATETAANQQQEANEQAMADGTLTTSDLVSMIEKEQTSTTMTTQRQRRIPRECPPPGDNYDADWAYECRLQDLQAYFRATRRNYVDVQSLSGDIERTGSVPIHTDASDRYDAIADRQQRIDSYQRIAR